ncbi:kelch repeat and BTB domain-containing protein 2 [Biomphalaria glabrata]|nr:kelch repeat and BTB domain-containing protein 2 [Biomphalaria glabrata]
MKTAHLLAVSLSRQRFHTHCSFYVPPLLAIGRFFSRFEVCSRHRWPFCCR